ncbi:hypothetical protein E4U54_001767, partial [Claviceps lovelessii]
MKRPKTREWVALVVSCQVVTDLTWGPLIELDGASAWPGVASEGPFSELDFERLYAEN